jgi:hypothetical protein
MNKKQVALIAYTLGLGVRVDGAVLESFGITPEEAEQVRLWVMEQLEALK